LIQDLGSYTWNARILNHLGVEEKTVGISEREQILKKGIGTQRCPVG